MPSLDEIREGLRRPVPVVPAPTAPRRAAVAVLLRARRPEDRPDVLFIERARRQGDPWSGHMAFPGGRVDPTDATDLAAAMRETREEVGLDLGGAAYLGPLAELEGRHAGRPARLVISAHVFHLPSSAPLRLNHEVRHAFWFPFAELTAPGRRVEHEPYRGSATRYPGILVGEPDRHVVWGLTYRFIEVLFERLERPLRPSGARPPADRPR